MFRLCVCSLPSPLFLDAIFIKTFRSSGVIEEDKVKGWFFTSSVFFPFASLESHFLNPFAASGPQQRYPFFIAFICSHRGSSYHQPKQCTIEGKILKFTIDLKCCIPPKMGNPYRCNFFGISSSPTFLQIFHNDLFATRYHISFSIKHLTLHFVRGRFISNLGFRILFS